MVIDRLVGALPVEEPVVVFALALAVFLIAPLMIKRAGLPGIVGIVLFGALIGPNALGILSLGSAIELLGNTLRYSDSRASFSRLSSEPRWVSLSSVSRFLPRRCLRRCFRPTPCSRIRWRISSTLRKSGGDGGVRRNTFYRYARARRPCDRDGRGRGRTDPLAARSGVRRDRRSLCGRLVRRSTIAQWFFQNLSDESYFEFLFVATTLFGAGTLAEVLGLDAILGAFVAGIALNRLIPRGGTLMNRIEFVGNAFFIPFFLLYVGMLVDIGVILGGPRTLLVTAVILGTMFTMKWVAAWVVSQAQGYDADERGVIYGLSVGQAAAALAITLVGFEEGLFTSDVLNAVVLMMLVATIVSPWLTEHAGQRLAQKADVEPGGDDNLDPRVLLPLSTDAGRQQRSLEFAFVLKDAEATEPVHLLTVIQPESGRTEEQVALVERDLERAAGFGGAAEVPIASETRVNHNIASGIVRGSVETRADMILLGWDASGSFGRRVFGDIIDQVLRRTTMPALVSQLGHPINTTKRIFLVLPHGVDHHEGFYEAIHIVKRLASKLGTPVTVLVVGGETSQYRRLFGLVGHEVAAEFEPIGWDMLLDSLSERTAENDLIVAVSPREGEVGWHDELNELPSRLVELPPHSFVMVYPRHGEPEYAARFLRFD